MEKLLKMLAEKKGRIVSTASLSIALINLAEDEGRYFVDGDGLGFVYIADYPEPYPTAPTVRKGPGFTEESLDNLFAHHPPKGDQAERYAVIRSAARAFAQTVWQNTPPCADQTVAIRKIQEAQMSANATIALNE